MPLGRKVVDRAIKQGVVVEAPFARAANGDPLYALAEDLAAPMPVADEVVRIIPPLDNLLFNRRRFEQELKREVDRVARYGAPGAVLVIDIDNFSSLTTRSVIKRPTRCCASSPTR